MTGRVARALATVGGLGELLPAPGTTVGSTAAVVAFLATVRLAGLAAVAVAVVLLVLLVPLAVVACGREASRRGVADPGPVVLDEVAGQWLALTLLAVGGVPAASVLSAAVCFLLFRGFDVVKPWPIRALERLPGGWGIVADDLGAGLAAAALQWALWRVLDAPL